MPEQGGDDKIYGGSYGTERQRISGGPYNDKIWTGHGNTGILRIYGDKSDRGDFTDIFPDGGDRDPLIEYPDTFNKYDGDDIIDVGNAN